MSPNSSLLTHEEREELDLTILARRVPDEQYVDPSHQQEALSLANLPAIEQDIADGIVVVFEPERIRVCPLPDPRWLTTLCHHQDNTRAADGGQVLPRSRCASRQENRLTTHSK